MPRGQLDATLRYLRRVTGLSTAQRLTDARLLERYVSGQDQEAFATLVHRYGRLVRSVCRHVLHDEQDIDDAFQVTFLVLAPKAASIRNTTAVASWLYGVAYRTAMNAKRARMRRSKEQRRATRISAASVRHLAAMRTLHTLPSFHPTLKRNGKELPDVPGYPLTRLLRSRLYLAYDALGTLKTLRGMAGSGDLNCPNADAALRLAESHVREYYDEIGPDWAERLKQGKTCAGVSALDLADSLGLLAIYQAFYRPASAKIHGSDASRYIEVTEKSDGGLTFAATSSIKGIAEALIVSSLVMLGILETINQRLGLKLDEQLRAIGPRIQQMTRRVPDE